MYSWIERPVRTHKESICRETKRATADLNIQMKSSRRSAANGMWKIFISSFFGQLLLKHRLKLHNSFLLRTVGCASSSNTEVSGASEVPQSRGKLLFLGSPAAVFLLKNRSRLSKVVSIEIDQNTKVQVIISTNT